MEKLKFKIITIIVLSILLLGTIGVTKLQVNGSNNQLEALDSRVRSLENEILVKQREDKAKEVKAVENKIGIADDKMRLDTIVSESYFKPVFTWSSGAGYNEMRDSYIEKLSLGNSLIGEYVTDNFTSSGENMIDGLGLSCTMNDFKIYPLNVIDDGYRYLAIVPYSIKGSDLSPAYAMVTFSLRGEGEKAVISEVDAYTSFDGVAEGEKAILRDAREAFRNR